MILTEYMIDVLSTLSGLVACIALLTGATALFSALEESISIKPSKAKLIFRVFVVFFCVVIIVMTPSKEVIRYFIAG